ncbi:MAG TPA: hypothetical protein VFN75_09260, partial [Pseudonocardiaceae bacterium]|nr:hypothetical protein [Pseudonocardiaceae bacterium]
TSTSTSTSTNIVSPSRKPAAVPTIEALAASRYISTSSPTHQKCPRREADLRDSQPQELLRSGYSQPDQDQSNT